MSDALPIGLSWRLRRIAAQMRQVDVAKAVGVSATYLSGVERGEISPTAPEMVLLDRVLPQLPSSAPSSASQAVNRRSGRGRVRRMRVIGRPSLESL
jgi:transcriptional regulator with XRE-family HTH domain